VSRDERPWTLRRSRSVTIVHENFHERVKKGSQSLGGRPPMRDVPFAVDGLAGIPILKGSRTAHLIGRLGWNCRGVLIDAPDHLWMNRAVILTAGRADGHRLTRRPWREIASIH